MKIPIKGVIVSNDDKWIYEWFGMDATSPKDVMDIIEIADGEDLEVEINSGGGDAYAGSEIYSALMAYKGKVIEDIVGIAGSAASVIAMAGRPTRISPTAQLMIHNAMSQPYGDHRLLQQESDILKNYNISIANAYRLKTGMDEQKLLELMDSGGSVNWGTWLNAQQALELKFVDEIMFDEGKRLVASTGLTAMLPPMAVNKLKNYLKQNEKQDEKPTKPEMITKDDLLAAVQLIVDELKPKNEPKELKPEEKPADKSGFFDMQLSEKINQLNFRRNVK
jgi:ATP-dependent Clp protease, protease subunit